MGSKDGAAAPIPASEYAALRKHVVRRCTERQTRQMILSALDFLRETERTDVLVRITRSGISFLGRDGLHAATHFTNSDVRGHRNFRASLRRLSIDI